MRWAGRRAPDRGARSAQVEAVLATLLETRQLWVAVRADDVRTARPALRLRTVDGGDLIDPTVTVDDQPGYTAARFDLLALPGDGDALADVVTDDGRPVHSGPLAERRVARSPDLVTRYAVLRTDDGALRVRRRVRTAVGELWDVTSDADTLSLTVRGAGDRLALVNGDEQVVAETALEPVSDGSGPDDRRTAVLSIGALLDPTEQSTRIMIGGPGDWTPVIRRDNDLEAPQDAVVLPHLDSDDGRLRLQLRWSPSGRLAARLLDVASEGEGG